MANTFTPEQIAQILEEFFKVVGTRQYIGARYVPLFGRKGEDSIEWDNSAPYEPLTIVLYQGNSYTSRQFVPTGVEITNQEFWALTGNYNAQVEEYRRETDRVSRSLPMPTFNPDNTVKDYIDGKNSEIVTYVDEQDQSIRDDVDNLLSNRAAYYNVVADMVNDSTIVNGLVCVTQGYYSIDDGGEARYIIQDTSTSDFDIAISNGLYAHLVPSKDYISIRQLGAIPDPTYNCKDVVEKFVTECQSYNIKKLYIPVGTWYMSETLITTKDGVEIFGEYTWNQYSTSHGTIIEPFNENQRYVIKFGGTYDLDETSLNLADECAQCSIHDLTFSGGSIDHCLDGFVVMRMMCYSEVYNLFFVGGWGTALNICDTWEMHFGFICIRTWRDFSRPCVHFKKNIAMSSGYETISSVIFDEFHLESWNGTMFKIDDGCAFVNNSFNIISGECTLRAADEASGSLAYNEENLTDAIGMYLFDGNPWNVTVNSICLTHGDYWRNAIYTVGDNKYYRDAIINVKPKRQGSANTYDVYNCAFGLIDIRNQGGNFCAFKSHGGYQQGSTVCGTIILEGDVTNRDVFDVVNGTPPVFDLVTRSKFTNIALNYDKDLMQHASGATVLKELNGQELQNAIVAIQTNQTTHWYFNTAIKKSKFKCLIYNPDETENSIRYFVYSGIDGSTLKSPTVRHAQGLYVQEITLDEYAETHPIIRIRVTCSSPTNYILAAWFED